MLKPHDVKDITDAFPVPVEIRHSARAKHTIIKINSTPRRIELVVPGRGTKTSALRFLQQRQAWVMAQLNNMPEIISFQADATLPILGIEHRIQHLPQIRGGVWQEHNLLHVTGYPEHISRRVTDYLKKLAKQEIVPIAQTYANTLGYKVNRITIRDTHSRWGSCASNGNLSFSWRLVLAPAEVLQYVVAHEVAHLQHMDHSIAFWQTVAQLFPDYRKQRDWLKLHGKRLFCYG